MRKACTSCKIVKDYEEFPVMRSHSTGRHSWCKVCMRLNARNSQKATLERAYQGDPTLIAILQNKSHVDENGCLVWDGTVHKRGYGLYNAQPVHLLWWILHNGSVPEGLELAHSCHNKLCLIHARPLTHSDNIWETPAEKRSRRKEVIL